MSCESDCFEVEVELPAVYLYSSHVCNLSAFLLERMQCLGLPSGDLTAEQNEKITSASINRPLRAKSKCISPLLKGKLNVYQDDAVTHLKHSISIVCVISVQGSKNEE